MIEIPDSELTPPGMIRTGLNFLAAISRYAAAGCPNVTADQFRARIEVCGKCHMCRHGRCLAHSCGCFIESKAQMATEDCPVGYWPKVIGKSPIS